MISIATEKKLLQLTIAVACVVPISAGFSGMVFGTAIFGGSAINLDSHFRYLSGLLFGIGLGFLSIISHIERNAPRAFILTALVVAGGGARLLGMIVAGLPSIPMILALGMELMVTPVIYLWIRRIALYSERSGLP